MVYLRCYASQESSLVLCFSYSKEVTFLHQKSELLKEALLHCIQLHDNGIAAHVTKVHYL